MANIFPTDFQEKLSIANGDYILFSDSEDGNKIKKAQYSNLKGEQGDPGTAATVAVGTVTTGAPGSSATVTNSGTSSAAVFNFTIPEGVAGNDGADGNDGAAATIAVGTTSTGAAGTNASVTNSGTSSAAVFNFTIPRGNTGNGISSVTSSKVGKTTTVTITETDGDSSSFTVLDGADGEGSGDVVGPASSTNGHLAVFDGATGKLIKDGGAVPTVPTDVSSFTNDAGYLTSATGVTSFNGSTGAVTYSAPVTSVNGSTGAVTVAAFSPANAGTADQVLTKTAGGYEWANASGGDVQVSTDANNILTSGTKLWAGTQANYEALGTYSNDTIYLTIE